MDISSIAQRLAVGFIALGIGSAALAASDVINANSRVVETDSNTSGLNNSVTLVNAPLGATLQASGNASFGSQPGEFYNSAVVSYFDNAGKKQYASLPMNGPGQFLYGSNFDCVLLTDTLGAVPGNTGICTITQSDTSGVIASGDIYAGSLSSAQTGVAQISGANAVFFNTTPVGVPQNFNIFVDGSIFYGPNATDQYGSVVVQYRDAGNGISYDSLPIGTSRNYFGFNFRVFITDHVARWATIPVPSSSISTLRGFQSRCCWPWRPSPASCSPADASSSYPSAK